LTFGLDVPGPTSFEVNQQPTVAMMILGFAGVGFVAYRRKSKPAPIAPDPGSAGELKPPSGGFLLDATSVAGP
jgi:hypothetical protein